MSKPHSFDNPHQEQETLWLYAAQHNLDAFAPFYECYVRRIYAYCLRRVNSTAEAEDLTSAIFARAMSAISSYRGGSPAAWLFQIAHNLLANHYRAKRPQIPLQDVDSLLIDALSPADPIEHILEREMTAAAEALLQTLSAEQQNLLLLKLVGGLNASEIGVVLNKRAGAVRIELHRIFKQLRRAYETHWPEED